MKIAILGTRGIPNNYGGFEQLAEYLSVSLVERGHEVYVYNSSLHSFKENNFKGVNIIHCFDAEDKIGTAGQFIYDLNCILDSRKRNFDVILQLGYTSSSIWSFLFPKQAKIITNMDGLEWKRSKYAYPVQLFLKQVENWAIHASNRLISDSLGIQSYIKNKYKKESMFIAYGAAVFNTPDVTVLEKHLLKKHNYFLVVARFEPENNIETIIKGYLKSNAKEPLILIGSTQNKFGQYIKSTYKNLNIQFLETIYDIEQLNNLRYFSKLYFHGHSVGGTNPSLLEAMASQALICAHKNEFNQSVLNDDALYFSDENDIVKCINNEFTIELKNKIILKNINKIETLYSWKSIVDAYENLMIEVNRA
jgi:glycosyltransferase involved in cell wall biosynthesis